MEVGRECHDDLMEERNGTTVFVDFGLDASDGLREGVHQNRLQEIFVDEDEARDWEMLHPEINFDSDGCVAFEDSSNVDQLVP